MENTNYTNNQIEGIAVIGMAGKFPGVENIYEYWDKIKRGEQLLTRFTRDELLEKGLDEKLLGDKNFVPVNGLIKSAEYFDSSFFGFTPREADLTDPQHRKFLEVCYEALEHSGTSPEKYKGSIGVFAGCSMNNYLLKTLLQHPDLLRSIGEIQSIVNNDKDFLTTKVSYKLNLTGPSYDVQTACSTSLVAIHVACQNLLNYQCDIALGGGVHLMNPRGEGYVYHPGSIESPDGICRPFDKNAQGTIFSEGVGVVVLKRLEDAIADNDEIWAVIKSTALNNDGSVKVGYMAPSIDGQAGVISIAQKFAEINPRTISFIETHGTGTNLGDPIEIKALSKVFSKSTSDKGFCAIGSVKGNIGHCDVAAGVAGFIKTVMALKYKTLPPSINFKYPNPELYIDESPFFVNTELKEWSAESYPRRAAVSSFGFGGTNAHCILEEWNTSSSQTSNREMHLLPLSAKSLVALNGMVKDLGNYIQTGTLEFGDVAHTLQNGRNEYSNRILLYGKNSKDFTQRFDRIFKNELPRGKVKFEDPSVVFMFTGQGSQYINMAKNLYESFSLYKSIVDFAHEILNEKFEINLKDLLFNNPEDEGIKADVNLTSNTQPLLFVVQYATACLLTDHGIFPDALIGHSIGELTAATLSGVFSFEDALIIVANRGKIMQAQKRGSMLSVNMGVENLTPLLTDDVELSLQNAPSYCVVSGTDEAITNFNVKLKASNPNVHTTVLKTSHAFHSRLMEPALAPFKEIVKRFTLNSPEIPFISNVSGNWITDSEAKSPDYWAKHIRSTVQFSKGILQLLHLKKNIIFIEIGPGNSLSVLLSQFEGIKNSTTISTIRHPMAQKDDVEFFMQAVGEYWNSGGKLKWETLYEGEVRKKVPLPTYPFEQKRHWIEPKSKSLYLESYDTIVKSESLSNPLNGKTNDPDLLHDRPNLSSKFVAPSNKLETSLVAIWQQLLGIKDIGTEDDFFALGGHSLLASQVIIRINEQLQVKLPLECLFKAPTVKLLIATYGLKLPEHSSEFKIEQLPLNEYYPLSSAQNRLWILDQIDQDSPAYNTPFTFKLKGKLDIEKFEQALELIIKRHQILDSNFSTVDNLPVLKIQHRKPKLHLIDLSTIDKSKVETKLQEFIRDDIRNPFDLRSDFLYRLYLIKTTSEEYVFHCNIHHILFDGWSWGIFAQEISDIYNSFLEGSTPKLGSAELQYFDFSNWQSKVDDNDLDQSYNFWIEQLKGIPTELKFPSDFKRPQKITGFGERESINIDSGLSNKLKEISQSSNSTLFMTMLTSFGILMNLYSGEDDICIGSPVANRTKSIFEKVIGFFVNTIVFRLKVNRNKTFKELLEQTRQIVINSLEHQHVPFEKLVEIIQPERQVNVNPIYQVMFAWQNAPRPPIKFNGVSAERLLIKEGAAPQDITFYMWEESGCIEGEIEYNTDILSHESIIHLKHNFLELLNDIASNINKPIDDLNFHSDFSKEALQKFNQTKVSLPDKLLHELFENIAEKNPERTAIITSTKQLSYKELNEAANKLANYLSSYNIKNKFVGVSLPRSEKMLITILAILKSGASYLPLDPDFPDERLSYILKDANAKLLITNSDLKSKFNNISTEIVFLDKPGIKYTLASSKTPKIPQNSDSLAYTIYTSGSTGNPKGVKVHHQAVVNFIQSMSKVPGMVVNDKLLAVTTLSFDISILEMFLPISTGATVVIANNNETNDGKALIELIEKFDITILQATPATWNLLILSGWQGKSGLKALCGGEAIQPKLIKDLLPKVKELWNMYGPTETTVWSTCYQITDPDKPVLVGKPIDNTTIFILDKQNRALPMGVFGEVAIGGYGVTKGYHNRDELTNEKFINSPDGNIIYKTGDNGRVLVNKTIELAGRIDNQIKLRGFRIEPGEIETLIGRETGVKEVVVKIHKFNEMDDRLVAFLTKEESIDLNVEFIKTRISSKLPTYMVPSAYVILHEFPRTPNGKIDRKALVYENQANFEKKIIKPQNELEEKLLYIWKGLLNIEEISVDDNFFSLGGHSLLSINLITKIEAIFKMKIELRRFFENPSIRGLAEYIHIMKLNNNKAQIFDVSAQLNEKQINGEL